SCRLKRTSRRESIDGGPPRAGMNSRPQSGFVEHFVKRPPLRPVHWRKRRKEEDRPSLRDMTSISLQAPRHSVLRKRRGCRLRSAERCGILAAARACLALHRCEPELGFDDVG